MGLLDRLKNIGTNPLSMAGLGLLSAPTHSRYPINPLQYGLQGMQAGYQNQQAQAEALARQQENAQRQQMYQLQVAEHQQKMEEQARARTLQQQQAAAQASWLANQPPEVAALANAYPDLFAEQMKQKMKPDKETTLAQNLISAGYAPGSPEYKAAMNKALFTPKTQISIGTGKFKVPAGYMMNEDETGVVRIPGIEPTEGQSAAGNYANRMQEAEALAQTLESTKGFDPTNLQENAASKLPMLGNYAMTPEFRRYQQAKEDWVRAKLRKESGAVIAKEEMEKEFQTYFPMPGDDPATIAQKQQARATAIEGMKNQSGTARPADKPNKGAWQTLPNGVRIREKQ